LGKIVFRIPWPVHCQHVGCKVSSHLFPCRREWGRARTRAWGRSWNYNGNSMQLQTGLLRHPMQRMFRLEVHCLEGRPPSASLLLRRRHLHN
jgi:hypothetical protein